ncbi:hypothetical protein ONZ45_g6361 [Pleurotus djamor]|nr:hypothetical protein ONZ45_g6361 [Pleurotus djamor]
MLDPIAIDFADESEVEAVELGEEGRGANADCPEYKDSGKTASPGSKAKVKGKDIELELPNPGEDERVAVREVIADLLVHWRKIQ